MILIMMTVDDDDDDDDGYGDDDDDDDNDGDDDGPTIVELLNLFSTFLRGAGYGFATAVTAHGNDRKEDVTSDY